MKYIKLEQSPPPRELTSNEAFDFTGWADQEDHSFPPVCSDCGADCWDREVVTCAPQGRTYVLDGIPEPGYTPNRVPRLVSDRLCRACAR